MEAWVTWLWQYIKYLYNEYKPKPKVRIPNPPRASKSGPAKPREYTIPREHTLEILRLYDNLKNTKGSSSVEKHLLWKRIQEILPQIPSGTWQIDASSVTNVVIKELIEKKK